MTRDKRVDDYIEQAAAFAVPILKHLRTLVHAAEPELEESIKWGMPSFSWQGRLVCGMAAFKQHCALNIWRAGEVVDNPEEGAMGQFGRIASLDDLPDDATIKSLIARRVALYREGKTPKRPPRPKPEARVPDDLAEALKTHARARDTFETFTPAQRREYIEWITEAKRRETRAKRLSTAIEWMAKGKQRNWKYM